MNWKNFREKFQSHAVWKSEGGVGSIIRFGSPFGGSIDGPEFLKELGLEEGMYKVRTYVIAGSYSIQLVFMLRSVSIRLQIPRQSFLNM
jgi:hypothetical protein